MLNLFVGDTLSFIGDQTSYMSICVGEERDDSLSQLSAQELRLKVNNTSGRLFSRHYIIKNGTLNVRRLKRLK